MGGLAPRSTDIVQQRLLVSSSMKRAWTAGVTNLPYDLVGLRLSVSDDGEPLSEWQVTVVDLLAFLNRRPSSEVG